MIKTSLLWLYPIIKSDKKVQMHLIFSVILLMLFILFEVNISYAYKKVYDAIDLKSYEKLLHAIIFFILIYSCSAITYMYKIFFRDRAALYIRLNLYNKLKDGDFSKCNVPCQRLSQDISEFGKMSLDMVISFLHAALKIPIFAIVILKETNYNVLLGLFGYFFVSFVFIHLVARPVVKLNSQNESEEGKLRKNLVKYFDKLIAFPDMFNVYNNIILLTKKEKILNLFISIFPRLMLLVPYIMIGPMYFSGTVLLGTIAQVRLASQNIHEGVEFFVTNRIGLVGLKTVISRLSDIKIKD